MQRHMDSPITCSGSGLGADYIAKRLHRPDWKPLEALPSACRGGNGERLLRMSDTVEKVRVARICVVCGEEWYWVPMLPGDRPSKLCASCRDAKAAAINKERCAVVKAAYPRSTEDILTADKPRECPWCKKMFIPHEAKSAQQRYCSGVCQKKAKNERRKVEYHQSDGAKRTCNAR